MAENQTADIHINAIDGFSKTLGNFNNALGQTESWSKNFGSAMSGIFQGAGKAVANFAVQGGEKLIGFMTDSFKVAGDFEAGMNRFEAAGGEAFAAAGMAASDFKDVFLDIGKRLPVSTMEVQDAAITLVKGGIDPLILKMGGLENSINFAAASNMSLADSADISIKMLSSFTDATATAEEKTKFLAMAQDMLVKADGAASSSSQKIAEAMLMAGGQANATGVEFQDFTTVMALLSDKFPSAAEAGTSYKNFLASLLPTTKKGSEAMLELGLATVDANGKMKSAFYNTEGQFLGNRKAAELLQAAFKGMTNEQIASTAKTIFGNDAMGAAIYLMEGGATGYDKYASAMAKANGVSAQAAANQKGFNVAMDNFNGSIEALRISLVTGLLPTLTTLFNNYLAPGVNFLSDLATKASNSGNAFGTITSEIDKLLPGFAAFATDAVAAFQSVYAWVVTNWPAIQTAIGAALTGIFTLVSQYIVPFAADLIVGLASAVNWVVTNWPAIQTGIETAFIVIGQFVYAHIVPFVDGLIAGFGSAVAWVQTNWPAIAATLLTLGTAAATLWTTYISPNVTFILGIFKTIQSWVNENWPLITSVIAKLGPAMGGVGTSVSGVWDTAKPILILLAGAFKVAFDGIRLLLKNFVEVGLAVLKAALQLLNGDSTAALETLRSIFTEKFDAIKTFVAGFAQTAYTLGKNIVDGLLNSIRDFGGKVADAIIAMVMGPIKTIQNMLGIDSPSKETYWMGEMMGDGFVFALEDAHDRVAAAMTYMMQGALDAGAMMSGAIQNAIGGGDMGAMVGAAVAGATGGRDSGDLDGRGGYYGPSSFVMAVDGKVLGHTAIQYGAQPTRASKRRTYGGGRIAVR